MEPDDPSQSAPQAPSPEAHEAAARAQRLSEQTKFREAIAELDSVIEVRTMAMDDKMA